MSSSSSSPYPQVALGGSASHLSIGRIGLGLMGLTWTDPAHMTPDAAAFATMKAALDAGSNLWDAGQFYGAATPEHAQANLHLVRRYFEAHPQDKDRVVLCVKGGVKVFGSESYSEVGMRGLVPLDPLQREDDLRDSLKQIRQALNSDNGGKDIDLWEPARFPLGVDPAAAAQVYCKLRDEGLFKHLALSEVKGSTIEAVVQASNQGVAAVEVEYSPFCREAEDYEVLQVCEKYKIPILAYSPVGKGLLTGTLRSRSQISPGDPRLHMDAFSEDNFDHNLTLADQLRAIADKRRSGKATPTQVTLAWLLQRSPVLAPIPGTRRAEYARENAEAALVRLSEEELKSIDDVLAKFNRKGGRYTEAARKMGLLWT